MKWIFGFLGKNRQKWHFTILLRKFRNETQFTIECTIYINIMCITGQRQYSGRFTLIIKIPMGAHCTSNIFWSMTKYQNDLFYSHAVGDSIQFPFFSVIWTIQKIIIMTEYMPFQQNMIEIKIVGLFFSRDHLFFRSERHQVGYHFHL